MTCDDYLATIATASLHELEAGAGRDHAARCADCERVTRAIVARERDRIAAFEHIASSVPAHVVGRVALATSRERHLDRIYAMALALAVAIAVWVVAPRVHVGERAHPAATPLVEEAFMLRCLSSAQAMELARPLLRTKEARLVANVHAPGVVTVRATAAQIHDVRATLDRYERAGSTVCPVVPTP